MKQLVEAKSIAIWGYGREGRATYNFIKQSAIGAKLTIISDDKFDDYPKDCAVLFGPAGTDAIGEGKFDLIIKSPGISLYRPEINTAKKAGTHFTSATNIWLAKNHGARTIAVTGTKGKSTTAKLIHHILCEMGIKAELGGNVGRPLMEIESPPEITVIELSSYQIADLEVAPDIAVALNLYPEHIPWHHNTENYYSDKLRIFTILPNPIAVLDATSAELKKRLGNLENVIWFNSPTSYSANDAGVYRGDLEIISKNDSPLLGQHNLSNIAAALCVVEIVMGDLSHKVDEIKKAILNFVPLPHRLEPLGEKDGVLFVNDSISTTPQSALAALKSFGDRKKIIILGGQDRGLDYTILAKGLAQNNVKAVLTVPDNGSLIARQLRDISPETNIIECTNLENAVNQAKQIASIGDIVLLSPAAPSFGHFKDYTERGDRFSALCGL
ncbi:MAG: UDP-N-acetylmuramoyl-L-alanine--D-glutamate ligase [Rhodospirillaceae bacterium]|nr:UDP-N-acetylmuramoyl-L-alanine--D-glutamate ligase [Rhodospirillaceae bacterium]